VNIEANQDFEAAFAEFSAPDDKKPEPAAAATDAGADGGAPPADEGGTDGGSDSEAAAGSSPDTGAGDTDAGAGAGGEGAAAEAPAAEGGEARAEAPEAVAASEAKPAAVDTDDVLNRLAKIVSEAKPAAEAPAAEAAPAAAAEERPIYNDEETEFLAGYEKDWADVVRGESLKRRAEYKELMEFVFQQVGQFVSPLLETTDTLAKRTHLADLKTNVPDYSDDLRAQVIEWAKTQPEYLQGAFNQVIQQGTADEVKDLVDRYRQATGTATPAPKPAEKKDNELSGAAKQAAAALAPVESKRSGVPTPSEPSNFDDAWRQFSTAKD
jgi:hypothetical protein